MLISCAWLRELVPATAEAGEIARRLTARGLTVDAVTEIEGDAVLDIDVPANRPDALGHLGVAREVAAAFGLPLAARPGPPPPAGAPASAGVAVTIEAPDLCGRYTAGIVRGVRVGASPAWVARRLESCGLRSINNVVDASNLVMLELGQPVHFFDLATLAGPRISVRRAAPGETMTTLDGVARSLDDGMLVIADAARGVALAGVVGGAETEIREITRDVLIEAAWFLPAAVRRTARALGVSTDASQRFERGCDPEAPAAAQALAARLLAEIAGGTAAPGTIDIRSQRPATRTLAVRLSRAERLLGYPPGPAEAAEALAAIGLSPRETDEGWEVTVPTWRVDLEREADVVEEIGRHLGYDRIPSRPPASAPRPAVSQGSGLEDRVRDRLASLGFCEAFNYAMIGPGEDVPFVEDGTPDALALTNPLAETLSMLRRSVLPGLLRSADQNLRRGTSDVRLFEVGRVFHARGAGQLPHEPLRAGFAWSGAAAPPHWSAPSRVADFYDAAGLVEEVIALTADAGAHAKRPAGLPGLHPGRSCAWVDPTGRTKAWCGAIHPDLAARLDLPAPVFVGEIDLAGGRHAAAATSYRPIPRVPGVWRDLSIVLDAQVAAGSVVEAFRAVPPPAPATFVWLDRYAGPPLEPGQVAMTLRVILQALDRTLTDAEAESFRTRLLVALDTVPGARLRRIDT